MRGPFGGCCCCVFFFKRATAAFDLLSERKLPALRRIQSQNRLQPTEKMALGSAPVCWADDSLCPAPCHEEREKKSEFLVVFRVHPRPRAICFDQRHFSIRPRGKKKMNFFLKVMIYSSTPTQTATRLFSVLVKSQWQGEMGAISALETTTTTTIE